MTNKKSYLQTQEWLKEKREKWMQQNALISPGFRCPKCRQEMRTIYECANWIFVKCRWNSSHKTVYMISKNVSLHDT